MRPYGERAPFEKTERVLRELTKSPGDGSSRTPLQDLYGTITPSALHYERHHAGVPEIDPAEHRLLIHGLVRKPLSFSLDDLKQFPSVSRTYFLECSGNSVGDLNGNPPPTVQASHGLLSCSEWTGVSLGLVLRETDLLPEAQWMIAEGVDACRMARSIPIEKALDDALLVYGQNGEPLRPEQGYPLRLLLPGWEGNANVKWLHRLARGVRTSPRPARTSSGSPVASRSRASVRLIADELRRKRRAAPTTLPAASRASSAVNRFRSESAMRRT
jgi:sulfane dehydrogenase subunit SoxC